MRMCTNREDSSSTRVSNTFSSNLECTVQTRITQPVTKLAVPQCQREKTFPGRVLISVYKLHVFLAVARRKTAADFRLFGYVPPHDVTKKLVL